MNPWVRLKRWVCDRAYARGRDAIEERRFKVARRYAWILKRLKWSGAFELLALAHLREDNAAAAEKTLLEGLSWASSVWVLWKLLGDSFSDQQKFDNAFKAYDHALACSDPDISLIQYNRAIALNRAGRTVEAINICEPIADEDWLLRVGQFRCTLLNKLERYEETLTLSEALLQKFEPGVGGSEERELSAGLLAERAQAFLLGRGESQTALATACQSLQVFFCDLAARTIREIKNQRSPSARQYRLLIEGLWQEDQTLNGERLGFFRTYDVLAEDAEEGLAMAREIEPAEVRPSMKLNKVTPADPEPESLKGVYWVASGRVFFPAEGQSG